MEQPWLLPLLLHDKADRRTNERTDKQMYIAIA